MIIHAAFAHMDHGIMCRFLAIPAQYLRKDPVLREHAEQALAQHEVEMSLTMNRADTSASSTETICGARNEAGPPLLDFAGCARR